MKNHFLLFVLCAFALVSCARTEYYHIEDGRIVFRGERQYYIGTNMWYAVELATSDYGRLCAELDSLKALGVWNLRILATDENWEGYDIVLAELSKREMAGVFYMNNAWEWSPDGYRSYLEQATGERQPMPAEDGYQTYVQAMEKFALDPTAVGLFQQHVRNVVSRYKDNPAIFSWQLCNEPRPFGSGEATNEAFTKYLQQTAALIKSIDPNHMVSTGNEGFIGCEQNLALFESSHNCPDIDYLTIHIWPYNWGWVTFETIDSGVGQAIEYMGQYIDTHIEIAGRLGKPLVIEEFGYPRDHGEFVNTSTTVAKDSVYEFVFGRVLESAKVNGILVGCNFWAWNGLARQIPGHQFYQDGDDLCGDPSHEAQGLYGVYITDSTVDVIRKAAKELE